MFVAQSTSTAPVAGRAATTVGRLNCIAQCGSWIELSDPPATAPSAATFLENVLPIYDLDDGVVARKSGAGPKKHIIADVPLSETACQDAWTQLIAFELGQGKQRSSYRPSPGALLHAWKEISAITVEHSLDLAAALSGADLDTLVQSINSVPSGLVVAILKHLLISNDESKQRLADTSFLDLDDNVKLHIDQAILTMRTGMWLLQTRSTEMLEDDFLHEWADLLPEAWRSEARMSVVQHLMTRNGDMVSYRPPVAGPASAVKHDLKASAKRKWHEKFKARKR